MRLALHTRVKAGSEEQYDSAHRAVPADLVDAIRGAGATAWTIWRSGQDLFHVIECDDYAELLHQLEHLPVNVEWQARMAVLQDVTHDYSAAGLDAGLPVVWDLVEEHA